MIWLLAVLIVFSALALLCAMLLTRPGAPADVAPMKHALERRIREGVEFRL